MFVVCIDHSMRIHNIHEVACGAHVMFFSAFLNEMKVVFFISRDLGNHNFFTSTYNA